MTGHTIRVKLDGNTVVLTPVCHEPDGAFCRLTCDQGCSQWYADHGEFSSEDGHKLEDIGYCNAIEYLTNDGADMAELCGESSEISLHDDMPITVHWIGDGYEWRKA